MPTEAECDVKIDGRNNLSSQPCGCERNFKRLSLFFSFRNSNNFQLKLKREKRFVSFFNNPRESEWMDGNWKWNESIPPGCRLFGSSVAWVNALMLCWLPCEEFKSRKHQTAITLQPLSGMFRSRRWFLVEKNSILDTNRARKRFRTQEIVNCFGMARDSFKIR